MQTNQSRGWVEGAITESLTLVVTFKSDFFWRLDLMGDFIQFLCRRKTPQS